MALRMFSLAEFLGKNIMHKNSEQPNINAKEANSNLNFPFALWISSSICQIN